MPNRKYTIQYGEDWLLLRESKRKYNRDLGERLFNFAKDTVLFLKSIKYSCENSVLKHQLAKSATSIGANFEEAQAAFSKQDFRYKMSICFREAKESNYWLRIIKETCKVNTENADELIKESDEIKRMFGSIMKKINFRDDVCQVNSKDISIQQDGFINK